VGWWGWCYRAPKCGVDSVTPNVGVVCGRIHLGSGVMLGSSCAVGVMSQACGVNEKKETYGIIESHIAQ
jgi:hypothetical protein